ncbi:hypothetical protein EVAR_73862_1 [Eumeta japonica]|uniref:Uncharacterized protein n=1 Tax=Eumeta variegata TaxID=151549 RepID=A0A4C2AD77_EUMVA|nr:hypothetical protein EVAR_73862_1 [Eumeta japonica]
MQTKADSLEPNMAAVSSSFDSSTYRKSKIPTDFKKQLKILKEPEPENVFKNMFPNFRRSFRDKFLQQQKETAYNPAWFVEVDTPPEPEKNQLQHRDISKENRNDLLVFENENFRPGSRSPIRELHSRREPRNTTRSPVKRNETFKVERLSRFDQQAHKPKPEENAGSIHIEFKNSITPHIPGRMEPVGVAKPMPSQLSYNNYYRKSEISSQFELQQPNNQGSKPIQLGRFQTLVQIKDDKIPITPTTVTTHNRLSTRIQLGNTTSTYLDKKFNSETQSPSFGKRYHSSQLLNESGRKPQPLKQTYFGETPHTAKISQIPINLSSSTSGLRARQAATTNYGSFKYQTPVLFASANSLTVLPASSTTTKTAAAQISTRTTTPAHSATNIYTSSNNNVSYHKQYQQQPRQQQQQTRLAVTGQRRTCSPLKFWR